MADHQYRERQREKRGKFLRSSYTSFYLQNPASSGHSFYNYPLLPNLIIFLQRGHSLIINYSIEFLRLDPIPPIDLSFEYYLDSFFVTFYKAFSPTIPIPVYYTFYPSPLCNNYKSLLLLNWKCLLTLPKSESPISTGRTTLTGDRRYYQLQASCKAFTKKFLLAHQLMPWTLMTVRKTLPTLEMWLST